MRPLLLRLSVLSLSLLIAGACAAPRADAPAPDAGPAPGAVAGPPAVILFIGDGAGTEYWSAAKAASSAPLTIEEFPVVGLVDTEAADSRITDSAAGATAYSTGVRTFNGAIGVGPDSAPVETVLEVAGARGWATGLVATSTVTHATPASFAAHVVSRNMHRRIAEDMARHDIDVLLGGGRRYFRGGPPSDDGPVARRAQQGGQAGQAGQADAPEDLLPGLRQNAAYVENAAAFRSLSLDTVQALVGLFAETHPGPATDRAPTLAELTRAALTVLARDEDGFFLMVEGSQIDWRGHENAPLRAVLAEMQDFDMAIRAALQYQDRHPNTLIVVTADHSTGGFVVHSDSTGQAAAHYTTEGHTLGMVPLFARGPGAEHFGGVQDNDRVGRLLLQLVRDGGVVRAP